MTLTVERLGHRGDGVAAGPVYAPLTLPGEVIEGEIVAGRIPRPRILTPSPDRVRAPCRHFPGCGGCALQHASDPFLAGWKVETVRAALRAQGLHAPIRGIETSPPASRRRAVLSARRTKKGALAGFHARASDTIVAVPECGLVVAQIAALVPGLAEFAVAGASRRGELSLTVTWTTAGADVAVRGGLPPDGPLIARLADIARRLGLARLSWDDETVAMAQPPSVSFDGIAVVPPSGAFLQATEHGEAALRRSVSEAVGAARAVADLFAGCGTFALPLARNAEVLAVESDAAALVALDHGWRRAAGLKYLRTEARDLFRRPLLSDELSRFDAVVIDPPRAGAEAQMRELARSRVGRIAAVSCNPVTFARDAAILTKAGYRLCWIDVVDQFRWSPHVELAAMFTAPDI